MVLGAKNQTFLVIEKRNDQHKKIYIDIKMSVPISA